MTRRTVYVALYHGVDAADWRRQHAEGIAPDVTPYGFHLAEELGYRVIFSQDAPRGRLASLATRLFGFDLVHAWTNRGRTAQADIVWTMTEGEGFAVAFLFMLRVLPRRPIICNAVWMLNSWHRTKPYKKWLTRRLLPWISVLTVHSLGSLGVARAAFPVLRSELMYFGINTDLFTPQPPPPELPGQPLHVVSLGADRTRDWGTLLAAFGNDPRFRLTIVCWRLGEADVAAYNNVALRRIERRHDLLACYQEAHVAVVPMVENVFSGITSALDAASVGVPVIATRTGGIPTYFTEDEVWLVPVGDAAAMREAAAASTAAERMEKARRAHARFVERDYSTRGLMRRYHAVTRSVLGD